jgi:S1-C subfamily serine protease
VAQVVPGSPAARAGIVSGDILVAAGRTPVSSAQELQRLMLAEAIGQPMPVTVLRAGAMVDVVVQPTRLRVDD